GLLGDRRYAMLSLERIVIWMRVAGSSEGTWHISDILGVATQDNLPGFCDTPLNSILDAAIEFDDECLLVRNDNGSQVIVGDNPWFHWHRLIFLACVGLYTNDLRFP